MFVYMGERSRGSQSVPSSTGPPASGRPGLAGPVPRSPVDLPLVSVCVLTYNQAHLVEACLASVLRQETDFAFEIVVGDDGSSDGTSGALEQLAAAYPGRIRLLLTSSNSGPTHNYLRTHAKARGKYIACLDGDDLLLPGKLQAQADILEARPDVNLVTHEMLIERPSGVIEPGETRLRHMQPRSGFGIRHFLALGGLGAHSSEMYRSERRVTAPGPGGEVMDTYAIGIHLGSGKAVHIPRPLGIYRSGIGNHSANFDHFQRVGIETLEYFSRVYPEYRAEVCAALLRRLEADIRGRRRIAPTVGAVRRSWALRAAPVYWRARRYRPLPGDSLDSLSRQDVDTVTKKHAVQAESPNGLDNRH